MLTTILLRLTITVNSVHVDNDSVGVQRSYQMRSDLHNVDDNDNVENDRSYEMISDLHNVDDNALIAQKAKLGFKLLLLERLNENLKQKHF